MITIIDTSRIDLGNKGSSSADNVDKHLQSLENSGRVAQQRQLSPEEQLFTEEELRVDWLT